MIHHPLWTLSLLILGLQVREINGEYRWAILSAFPKPMPTRHDSVVFPKFFVTNKSLDLPYVPYDSDTAPLGENRTLGEKGSLCFQLEPYNGSCIPLQCRMLGLWDGDRRGYIKINQNPTTDNITINNNKFWQQVTWFNTTFVATNITNKGHPRQPKVAPHCQLSQENVLPPWSDCQSYMTRWADPYQRFILSPDMMAGGGELVMQTGIFEQDRRMNPFSKWVLCGVNGSCTDLNPFGFIQGGAVGVAIYDGESNYTAVGPPGHTKQIINSTECITAFNKTIVDQTVYSPTPVCVYPPFLFILSNDSFETCFNDSCWISQCWHPNKFGRAMVARIPRWIPVPVKTPGTLSLFRQKRDFGITALVIFTMSAIAATATASGLAMSKAVQTAEALNTISAKVSDGLSEYTSANAQLKGGLMIVNQRLDLVEERLDILFQLAQLGCERKVGVVCITSVQYENFTRAANLSRQLSSYLAGQWSEEFEATLEKLRAAVIAINSIRMDLSLTEGLSSWISSAFSHFKEWVGVALFGATLCCGLVFMLWLVCKLRSQQRRDKVIITQALAAIEQGASPDIWLSMLKD